MASNAPDYNILLLGETGTGKSMLINSLANYIKFQTLEEAQNGEILRLIPSKFTISDDNYEDREIIDGKDENECVEQTQQSGTIACKTYLFHLPNCNIRIIDSAGVGAAEGVDMDAKNIDDVLDFISHYDNLHVIALVINNNQPKLTQRFQYCFKQLVTHLDKSAADNIVFLLTFSEGTGFKPGPVVQPLKALLTELRHKRSGADIQLRKDIMYCMDNKGFQCLLARKQGVEFTTEDMNSYNRAWDKSTQECDRLLQYIIGHETQPALKPHKINEKLAVKDAKKFIKIIEPFIKDATKIIESNSSRLTDVYYEIKTCIKDMDFHKRLITIMQMDIDILELDTPQTVCTSDKCSGVAGSGGGDFETSYPNLCCPGCSMTSPYKRLFCQAIELLSGNCKKCGCHANEHQVLYYVKVAVEKEVLKLPPIFAIDDESAKKEQLEKTIEDIVELQRQLETEKSIIKTALLIFSKYLERHARTKLGGKKPKVVQNVTNLAEDELLLDDLIQYMDELWIIDTEEIFKVQRQLFEMKINGPAIRKVYEIQTRAKERAASVTDIITTISTEVDERWHWLVNKVQAIAANSDVDLVSTSFTQISYIPRL